MRFPHIPNGLLRADPVILARTSTVVDADGNDVSARTTVATVTRGLYTLPSAADLSEAGERSTKIDAIIAFPVGTDVRAGDRVTVRNAAFDVITVEDARNRLRVHIRKITTP